MYISMNNNMTKEGTHSKVGRYIYYCLSVTRPFNTEPQPTQTHVKSQFTVTDGTSLFVQQIKATLVRRPPDK